MKIYVASSWRNTYQPGVVEHLRTIGFEVYDFKKPSPEDNGFHWSEIDGGWETWTTKQYLEGLKHPIAIRGYSNDIHALQDCDACVLVLPCGRSAHLELGWAVGQGKYTAILIEKPIKTNFSPQPELMYKMVDLVTDDLFEIELWLRKFPYHASSKE